MSLLASVLKPYFDGRSYNEVAALTDGKFSRESLRRTINSVRVCKLSSLLIVMEALKLNPADRDSVLAAWAKSKLGPEAARRLIIKPVSTNQKLGEAESETEKAMMLFTELNPRDRASIVAAMKRKATLRLLASLNDNFPPPDEPEPKP